MKISKLCLTLAVAGVIGLASMDAFAARVRKPCPAGTYSKAGATSLAGCIKCSTLGINKYSASEGASACSTCQGGKIANAEGTGCIDTCKKGYLLVNGKCIACTAENKKAGFICDGTTEFTCKKGYYKAGTTCKTCVKNAESCTSGTDFVCKQGFFKRGTACVACPTGAGVESCTPEGFTCNVGFYENKTTCTKCEAGYYCE